MVVLIFSSAFNKKACKHVFLKISKNEKILSFLKNLNKQPILLFVLVRKIDFQMLISTEPSIGNKICNGNNKSTCCVRCCINSSDFIQ